MKQSPGESIVLSLSIDNLKAETEYELRIGEYGNVNGRCPWVGEVFNPLAKYNKKV